MLHTVGGGGGASPITITGVVGKWGAMLKASALAGNLDNMVGKLDAYDVADEAGVDDDATDITPAIQACVDRAIADGGTGPIFIRFSPTASFWRMKTGVVHNDGTHTLGALRLLFFVGYGDASPVRVDVGAATIAFDLDVGNGTQTQRDMRFGFCNVTFVTSNEAGAGYLKGPDCKVLIAVASADTTRVDFINVKLVGIWSQDNHLQLLDGSPHFDSFLVLAGYCGPVGGRSICQLTSWAVMDAIDAQQLQHANFRGTQWINGGVAYGAFFEVVTPQDYDSTIVLRRCFHTQNCLRMVWCNQAGPERLRMIHASNFVTATGLTAGVPTFDLRQAMCVVVEEGEYEFGGSEVIVRVEDCADVIVRHVRSDYGPVTSTHVEQVNCASVKIDECDLGTDSPHPHGIITDGIGVTKVVKGGVEGVVLKAANAVTKDHWGRVNGDMQADSSAIAHPSDIVGFFMADGVAGDYVGLAHSGQLVTMESDGTGPLAAGDAIAPGAAGQVQREAAPATHAILGRVLEAAAAVAGTKFRAVYHQTWGG
ncbi:MAG: hypothetical protein JWM53_3803 [bacterium]|nr:hypothetical protein [bacterium]